MSCFGCHFKIKNFTMSTCLLLLLLLLCPQSTMIKTIFSWNRFHGKKCLEKKKLFTRPYLYYPHHHATYCLLSPPPPYCCYVGSTYICIIKTKKITFFRFCKKTRKYFPLQNFLTSNIYALSLNPHKKKLRENLLGKNEI